jgi:hypothetical protein
MRRQHRRERCSASGQAATPVSISAGSVHSYGLKSDGSLAAVAAIVEAGERIGFADLERLFAYLLRLTDAAKRAPPPTDE